MSVSLYDVRIGQVYNFSLLASQILGNGYSNATLQAVIGYNLANTIQSVGSLHAAALPSLPTGTQSDPTQLIYYLLTTSTGAQIVIAEIWLAQPPTLVTATTFTVNFSNVSLSDQPRLQALLNANGFNSFTFS